MKDALGHGSDYRGGPHKRLYPAYTLDQLKKFHAEKPHPLMAAEIAAREAGVSRVNVTPQIQGGMPIPRLGRM